MSKISNEVRRTDNFRALARKLSFLPIESHIFDIRQQYVRILFIFQYLICSVFIMSNINNHEFSRWIRCCNDVMNKAVKKHDVYPQKMHSCSKTIHGISVFVLKISVIYINKNIYHRCYCMVIPLVER